MMTEGGLRYTEALALADRGRWRTARTRCLAALAEDPDDPLTRTLLLRADAEVGRLSFADAESAVRRLSNEHPNLKGLRMRAAGLLARRGKRVEALREARAILAEDQDDPAAHEFVAALSCCEDDVTESFLHYKMALDLGGLTRPASRLAALWQARRLGEPASTSARILAGALPLEWLAMRTVSSRTAGRAVGALLVFGWALGVSGNLWLGVVGVALGSALAGWRTFCCLYICWNRQELSRFASVIAAAWIPFAVLLWLGSQMPRVVLVVSLGVAVAIAEFQEMRKHRRPGNPPVDAAASM
jgi:tetratricopeptide (TPR) repeat protein